MKIANLIKKNRKKLGLSQEQLAHGITNQTVLSRIEKGTSTPSIDLTMDLLKKLNIPLEQLAKIYGIDPTKNNSYYNEIEQLFYKRDYKTIDLLLKNIDTNKLSKKELSYIEFFGIAVEYFNEKKSNIAIEKLQYLLKNVDKDSLLYTKILYTLGIIYDDIENFELALLYFDKVMPNLNKMDSRMKYKTLYSLSRIYCGMNDFGKANKIITELITNITEDKSLYLLADSYYLQSYIFEKTNLFKSSLESLKYSIVLFEIEKNDVMKNMALTSLQKLKEHIKNEEIY